MNSSAFKCKTVAIIGLGLMGGSLAAACRKKFPRARVVGISRNRNALRVAKKKRWIHDGTRDLREGVKSADLVVICTPVDTFQNLLTKIEKYSNPGTLVTDVGSVKGSILRWTEKKRWKKISFVGAHPMVGSHKRGIQACEQGLYEQGYTFLVRNSKVNRRAYTSVKGFWKKISRKVVELSAQEHDLLVGEISHLPHAVAVGLMLTVHRHSLRYVASGFRDSTRIAAGAPSVWVPIFISNRAAILKSLSRFEKSLKTLQKALRGSQEVRLRKLLAKAVGQRQQI